MYFPACIVFGLNFSYLLNGGDVYFCFFARVSEESHCLLYDDQNDNNANHDEDGYALQTSPHSLTITFSVVCLQCK